MKQAILFPGQGTQTIGMGKDFYDSFQQAKDVFNEVDDALNYNLSNLIFNGDIDELTLTQNAQPALMTVSMAIWAVLKKQANLNIKDFSYAAGHSLGQYSALCAAQSLTLKDTACLLCARGAAMAQACLENTGAMAAVIGLDRQAVQEIADKTNTFIANDNATGQIVISGLKEDVINACEISTQQGAKRAITLNVAGAFHSPLMQSAQIKMKPLIEQAGIQKAQIPVVSNVKVLPLIDEKDIKEDLILQITGQVEWTKTQHYLKQNGVEEVLELGAGNVLAGLMRRTEPDIKVYTINNVASLEAYLNKE